MKKLVAATVFTVMATVAQAVPTFVNYQGTLLDNNNIPVTQSNVPVVVSIWNHPTNTTVGNRLYQENHTVNVNDGNFSFPIGSGSSPIGTFNASLFNTASTLYLQLTINGEALLPRVQFMSAPYTLQSENTARFGNQLPSFYATASALSSLQNQVDNLNIPSAKDICMSTFGSVWLDNQNLCVGGSVDLSNKDISGENISGVWLYRATLAKAKLNNTVIQRAWLNELITGPDTELGEADLRGSTLNATDLTGIDLSKTLLAGLYSDKLTGCPQALPEKWECVQISEKPDLFRLVGPTARFADDANLPPASWDGVTLPTNLNGINLRENLLRNCTILPDTNFTNADLFGARFVMCDIGSGIIWNNTTCPDGSNSNDQANDGSCYGKGFPLQK